MIDERRPWASRRVYGGRLIEANDTRLVFVRSPAPSPVVWLVLLGLGLVIVALWFLVRGATIPPLAAALASPLPSFLFLMFGWLPLAIARTRFCTCACVSSSNNSLPAILRERRSSSRPWMAGGSRLAPSVCSTS